MISKKHWMTRGNLRSEILGTIIELIFPVAFSKKKIE
jgi:hypothetical protein